MQISESVVVCEWFDDTWRERRVRIAPCPDAYRPDKVRFHHELTVADVGDEGLSQVYCTYGWIGEGAETDEQAVAEHNRPHGFGIEPLSDWIVHNNAIAFDFDCDGNELPF